MSPRSEPEVNFRRQSRTFSLAARLFAPEDRGAITRLYHFCRTVDDWADATREGERARLQAAIDSLASGSDEQTDPVVSDFMCLASERGISLRAAISLVEALREDCGPREIQDECELVRFAFGVAGTVGLMICPVLGVTDERASAFAVDLGIAFQLTNIARDVVEDADRGRCYLPANRVAPEVVGLALGGDDGASRLVDSVIRDLLGQAEDFYASAVVGMKLIPPRNRRAVFVATVLYREIGRKLLRSGSGAWRTRTVVTGPEKLKTLSASVYRYWSHKREDWKRSAAPVHPPFLERQLQDAGINLSEYL